MKAIKVSLCPETGIPLVPDDIKERVRNGEKVSIELMTGTQGFVKNALRHNCAGLWIDGCRIEVSQDDENHRKPSVEFAKDGIFSLSGRPIPALSPKGRYPKNVIHDSSEEVLAEFAKAGVRKSTGGTNPISRNSMLKSSKGMFTPGRKVPKDASGLGGYGDVGTPARYFQSCPPDNHCPTCNNTDVPPSFEEWVKDTNGTREEYERLLKPGYMVCGDCCKPPGRYPKNIIVDGSKEVKAEFDKAGNSKSSKSGRQRSANRTGNSGLVGLGDKGVLQGYGDEGSKQRYFQTCPSDPCPTCKGTRMMESETSFDDFMNNPYEPPPEYEACPDCIICPHCMDTGVEWPDEDIDNWLEYAKEHPCPECRSEEPVRFKYVPKASKRERNRGLDGMDKKPAQSTGWSGEGMPLRQNGTERKMPLKQNTNPCVKPLSLIRYLCRISKTPTGGIVLDPFLGSGTTSLAAFLEGRASIGIEQSAEYCSIAANRLAYEQSLDPDDRVKDK